MGNLIVGYQAEADRLDRCGVRRNAKSQPHQAWASAHHVLTHYGATSCPRTPAS
jgi:hypothetical protein